MRIHLICDHKWRDLPNNAVLKIYLERAGHRVSITSLKDAFGILPAIRPHAVVFNHMFGSLHPALAHKIRAAGAKVIVLPTEGSSSPKFEPISFGEFSDFSAIDLYLSWSDYVSDGLRSRGAVPKDRIVTTGFFRFDFHVPPLSHTTETRDSFCARYRLDPRRPIISWATQYNYAHLERGGPQWEKFEREFIDFGGEACFSRYGLDFRSVPDILRRSRLAAVEAFTAAARQLADVQFILKPHPAENVAFYRERFGANQLANVVIAPNELIWNVLNATDILLHRHCTTAVEAWTRGLPTVEMAMHRDPAFEWPEIEAGSDIAESAPQLVDILKSYLGGSKVVPDVSDTRLAFIAKHFHAADGRRTYAAAKTIDAFLRTHAARGTSFVSLARSTSGVGRSVKNGVRYWADVPGGVTLRDELRARLTGFQRRPESNKNITRRDVARTEREVLPYLAD